MALPLVADQAEARAALKALRDGYKHGPERWDADILKRESSTVRRWLRGGPIPQAVIQWLDSKKRVAKPEPISNIGTLTGE